MYPNLSRLRSTAKPDARLETTTSSLARLRLDRGGNTSTLPVPVPMLALASNNAGNKVVAYSQEMGSVNETVAGTVHKFPQAHAMAVPDNTLVVGDMQLQLAHHQLAPALIMRRHVAKREEAVNIGKPKNEVEAIPKGLLVYYEVGTGKTLTALQIIRSWLEGYQPGTKQRRAMVITTHTNIDATWEKEWKDSFKATLVGDADVVHRKYVVQTESAILKQTSLLFPDADYDFIVIVDEAHKFRNADAEMTKNLYTLVQKADCKYTVLLTGTPLCTTPEDMDTYYKMIFPKAGTLKDRECDNVVNLKQVTSAGSNGQDDAMDGMQEEEIAAALSGPVDQVKFNIAMGQLEGMSDCVVYKGQDKSEFPRPIYTTLYVPFGSWYDRWAMSDAKKLEMAKEELAKVKAQIAADKAKGLDTTDLKKINFGKICKDLNITTSGNAVESFLSDSRQACTKADEKRQALTKYIYEEAEDPVCVFTNWMTVGTKGYYDWLLSREGFQDDMEFNRNRTFRIISKEKYGRKIEVAWYRAGDAKGLKEMLEWHREHTDNSLIVPRVRVLLLSSAAREGVSLVGVKDLLLADPAFRNAEDEQAIGRAMRRRSHDHLPKEERWVRIVRFVGTSMSGNTADQKVRLIALARAGDMLPYTNSLKNLGESLLDKTEKTTVVPLSNVAQLVLLEGEEQVPAVPFSPEPPPLSEEFKNMLPEDEGFNGPVEDATDEQSDLYDLAGMQGNEPAGPVSVLDQFELANIPFIPASLQSKDIDTISVRGVSGSRADSSSMPSSPGSPSSMKLVAFKYGSGSIPLLSFEHVVKKEEVLQLRLLRR